MVNCSSCGQPSFECNPEGALVLLAELREFTGAADVQIVCESCTEMRKVVQRAFKEKMGKVLRQHQGRLN